MTIEIKKKQLIILGVIVAIILCAGGGYGLYSWGYSSGYKEGHTAGRSDGIAETVRKYESPKGDGSIWYAEVINDGRDNLYHSTIKCPNIKNGINENWGFTNPTYRKQHSQFCSKCMDSKLIGMCQTFLYTDSNWK